MLMDKLLTANKDKQAFLSQPCSLQIELPTLAERLGSIVLGSRACLPTHCSCGG